MIPIRDIDHLVLRITDLGKMLHFYGQALGCTVERRQDVIGLEPSLSPRPRADGCKHSQRVSVL
jgi:catechol 2,3-dioxygenase-like lactoylglutathione lyase family enzyme